MRKEQNIRPRMCGNLVLRATGDYEAKLRIKTVANNKPLNEISLRNDCKIHRVRLQLLEDYIHLPIAAQNVVYETFRRSLESF